MRANRNKIISQYQKEANLLRQDDPAQNQPIPKQALESKSESDTKTPDTKDLEETATTETPTPQQAELEETNPTDATAADVSETPAEQCPHVLSVYETVMLIQLKRMIKRNTKAFAVMLKILIQGDPKRRIDD